MAEEVKIKRTAKDSVFTNLFSTPKYVFELYQAIHPEDDVTVHMLYDRENGDIIHQYITFCKVLTAQIKKHGQTRKAVEETLLICRDKNVLEEYLKQRETEIMDIMTTLFDQDYVTKLYGIDQRREGMEEGKKEEKIDIAKAMKADGMPIDLIEKYTGLSEEEIIQ